MVKQTGAVMKKRHLTLKKLHEKISQWFIVISGVLNNISKVHENVKISRWLPPVFFFDRFKKNNCVRFDCTAL